MRLKDLQIELARYYALQSPLPDSPSEKPDFKSEISIYIKGLTQKRLHAVKSLLPLTFELTQKTITEEFYQYVLSHPIQGLHLKHQFDALAFGSHIRNQRSEFEKEILSWEMNGVKRQLPSTKVQFYFWKYPLEKNWSKNLEELRAKRKIQIGLYVRFSLNQKWKRISIW